MEKISSTVKHPPRLTIAILSYNRGHYLQEMVRSVLAQTETNFEVVIWDNASLPGTLEFLDDLEDDRVSVVVQPRNVGATENGNCAISACKTELLLLTHDDDRLKPHFVETYLKVWDSQRDLSLLSCDADLIDSDGSLLEECYMSQRFPGLAPRRTADGGYARDYVAGLNYIVCPTVMLDVQTVLEHNVRFQSETGPASDSFFFIQLSYCPGSFLYLSDSLYQYRLHVRQDSQIQASSLITRLRVPLHRYLLTRDTDLAKQWWENSKPSIVKEWMDSHRAPVDSPVGTFLYRILRVGTIPYFTASERGIVFLRLVADFCVWVLRSCAKSGRTYFGHRR